MGSLLGHLLPQVFEGIRLSLIEVPHFIGFQPADHTVANIRDPGDKDVVAVPAIKEDKGGVHPLVPRTLHHVDCRLGFLLQGFFPPLPSIRSPVDGSQVCIRTFLRGMKGGIEGKEVGSIVVAQLDALVAENGPLAGVIKMVAYQFHLFAGLSLYRIIDDECLFFQRRLIADGNNPVGQTVDKRTPVEAFIVEKTVIGILPCFEYAGSGTLRPEAA